MNTILDIKNLHVSVDDKPILKGFSLQIAPGTVHALMGPNGSGKSTLAYALMGHPGYHITAGSVFLAGKEITHVAPDKRAHAGLFLAFQHPYEIPGVKVHTFLKEAYQALTGKIVSVKDFHKLLQKKIELLSLDPAFAYRDLNDGFSGGEKKRLEMLQLMVLQPKVAILDEIDSGLDVDALKVVTHAIAQIKQESPSIGFVVITHYQRILNYLQPDYVHILLGGVLSQSGSKEVAYQVEEHGYDQSKQ